MTFYDVFRPADFFKSALKYIYEDKFVLLTICLKKWHDMTQSNAANCFAVH